MPGKIQDSTEWDRTDMGHSTDKHLHMWSRYKLLFWTPLVISYKKYIYILELIYKFSLESDLRPLYWWPPTLNIQLNAIQSHDFLEHWTLSDTSEQHDWPKRNSNQVSLQSLRQAPGFLDRGPWPVVPSCRGSLQKRPNHTVKNQIRPHLPQKIMVSVRGLIMGSAASSETPHEDLKAKLVSLYTLSRWQKVSKLIHTLDWETDALSLSWTPC